MTTLTIDALALRALLDSNRARGQQRLTALAALAQRIVGGGFCPECGAAGPHDDNGASGADLTFCCTACGTHFDA